MKVAPKKWTHHHTRRLFHLSFLAIAVFFIFCIIIGMLFMLVSVRADSNVAVGVTVGGVTSGPAQSVDEGSGPYYPVAPQPTPPNLNSNAPVITLTVDNSTVTSKGKTVATQYPSFHGSTNILNSTVYIQIDSQKYKIRSNTKTDADGNWIWPTTEPLSPGLNHITVVAQSNRIPSLSVEAETDFYVQLPAGQTPQPPVIILNPPPPAGAAYDVFVTISEEYKTIKPGAELQAQIRLQNFSPKGSVNNIDLEYIIKDSSGNIISDSKENTNVSSQTMLLKTFYFSPLIKEGDYTLIVRVPSADVIATASDTFSIKGAAVIPIGFSTIDATLIFQALILLLFLFSIVTYLEYNKVSILTKVIKKASENDIINA